MGFISQKFIQSINDRTKLVAIESYNRITQDLHWDKFAKLRDVSGTANENIVVPVDDAVLDWDVPEGFLAESTSYSFSLGVNVNFASRSKTILRSQYTDGPEGAEHMASWGRNMGRLFARAPEDLVLDALRANAPTPYDGKAIFATDHAVHPSKNVGSFSNDLSGGTFAIDPSVTLEVALANLNRAISTIYRVPTPSGKHSRRLVPKYLVVPSELRQRAIQLTESSFIGTQGSTDVSALIKNNGLQVAIMPELSLNGGSPTKYYLCCEPDGEIGTFIVGTKEPFELVLFNPQSDSHADEQQSYTSRARGRMGIAPALPFYTYRCGT